MQVRWKPNDVLASLAQVLTNLAVDPSFAKVRAPCYPSSAVYSPFEDLRIRTCGTNLRTAARFPCAEQGGIHAFLPRVHQDLQCPSGCGPVWLVYQVPVTPRSCAPTAENLTYIEFLHLVCIVTAQRFCTRQAHDICRWRWRRRRSARRHWQLRWRGCRASSARSRWRAHMRTPSRTSSLPASPSARPPWPARRRL